MAGVFGWERRAHIFGQDWVEWDGSIVGEVTKEFNLTWWIIALFPLVAGFVGLAWAFLVIVAPVPRLPHKSEKKYITINADGSRSSPAPLPCWHDDHEARKKVASKDGSSTADTHTAEPAEVILSVVVPAYNEEQRIRGMLEESIDFLEKTYSSPRNGLSGWEIIVVSDGSEDKTVHVVLDIARERRLHEDASNEGSATKTRAGKAKGKSGTIRVIVLEENRGKGGAVTHGLRHVRGQYAIFADADGASRFSDVANLIDGCERVKDDSGRAVAVGSRHHLVGSEAVVERSFLRNALMHSFHLLLRLMTPSKTAAIKDTQCGFKMFTRPALPYIIPYMHVDGWIFDVEMLMLAEYAKIPMVEVSIGWKEVKGSKLNVIWDSLGMAWSLFVLRAAWLIGIYQRDF